MRPSGWSKNTNIVFTAFLLLLLLMPWITLTGDSLSEDQPRFKSSNSRSTDQSSVSMSSPSAGISDSYESHPPINIDGNQDFMVQATAGNWFGEGTVASPYVIEGFSITGTLDETLITIRDTDVFFRISSCLLRGGSDGIHLEDTTNGQISGNILTNNSGGSIFLRSSRDSTITNNTIINNGGAGIFLLSSRNSSITNNTIADSGGDGISLWDSGRTTISSNTVTNNGGAGIALGSSSNSTISRNTLSNNGGVGIVLASSGSSSISGNIVVDNSRQGILIFSSDDNSVIWNVFIGNNPNGSSQAYDDGTNNTFGYNYWNEWTDPDTNLDGVVDQSYRIDGGANNQDNFPRTSPMQGSVAWSIEHIFTSSILILIILVTLGISVRQQRRALHRNVSIAVEGDFDEDVTSR